MKITGSIPIYICCISALLLFSAGLHAQQATTAAGGDATGPGGSVAYSVGQVVYTTNSGTGGSVAEGVQQSYSVDDGCSNAIVLYPTTFPAINNTLSNLSGASSSGEPACAGSSDGSDRFFSFTADVTNTYIINVNPLGGSDIVVQVLDSCGGNQLACVNENGAGESEWVLLEALAPGDYVVRVHNVSGDAETSATGGFLINVQQLPLAQVQDNPNNILYACNQTGFQLEDFVGATPQTTPGILDYEWFLGEENGTFTNVWQRGSPNYSTRIEWLDMEYGKTYNVFVRVLVDHAHFGPLWGVFQGDYQDPNNPGASMCTISTSSNVTPTELRPNYTPTNVQGNDYALCDFAVAYNVSGSQDFRWRFDPDTDPNNTNEILYIRGSANPSVRLSWVNGLIPGLTYNVAVEVQVAGQWSGYSTILPLSIGLPPNDVQLRNPYCGGTYSLNGYVLSESVCEADVYSFEFEHTISGSIHTRNSANYVCFLNSVSPTLSPGDYNVRVKVTQNGVPGDYGPSCVITISGAGMAEEGTAAMRDIVATGNATLFPNPNAGSEVRLQLDGLSDGNHDVNIVIYDIHGKMINTEAFGHEGTQLNRLVRFDSNLSMGMYMVQIVVDGERFATERLVVKRSE